MGPTADVPDAARDALTPDANRGSTRTDERSAPVVSGFHGRVPVAAEVARVLDALDVIVVRKLGVPMQPDWPWRHRRGRRAC